MSEDPSSNRIPKSRFSIKDLASERTERAANNWERVQKLLNLQKFLSCAHDVAYDKQEGSQYQTLKQHRVAKETFKDKYLANSVYSVFDLVISCINLYLAFSIPFRLSFYLSHQRAELYPHDLVLDSILFFHFLTMLMIPINEESFFFELYSKHPLSFNLIRLRFYTDLLSVIPLYMMDDRLYWLKLGRILRVDSIFDWITNSTLSVYLIKKVFIKYYDTVKTTVSMMRLSVLLLITCHCIACMWYLIPSLVSAPKEDTWLGSDWALYSTSENYMRSLYWTAVTFSSVGYGDIVGHTTQEYIFSMFVEFLGIMGFAYLMGALTNSLGNYYNKIEQTKFRENELMAWLIFLEEKIADSDKIKVLQEQIEEFFNQKWMCNPRSLNHAEDYFMMMPPNLAKKLAKKFFDGRLGVFRSFFNQFSEDVKYEVSALMHSESFAAKVEAVKEKELNHKIYFVAAGSVAVGLKNKGYALMLEIGSYFGEDSALFADESRVSFISRIPTFLFGIEWPALRKIFRKHKIDLTLFAKLAFKRAKYFEHINEFKFGSDYYVSDREMAEFSAKFNLNDGELTMEEEEEFDERSLGLMKSMEKKGDEENGLSKQILMGITKNSDKLAKEAQAVYASYEKGMKEVIEKIGILDRMQRGNKG